jgi:1-aminocyclopropane-1-carboxylate deaminase
MQELESESDVIDHFQSPVHEIREPLLAEKGLRLYLKRDDLIHPFVSGNKWRKLKHTLQSAKQRTDSHLVTFGGPWSNHLLAAACAAASHGMHSTAFVRGEAVQNYNLMLCRIFGMKLLFSTRESYRNKRVLFDAHFKDVAGAFFVDEGGAGPEAVLGCSELVAELPQVYDHIFCAAGTGTTIAGLAKGVAEQRLPTRLHAACVLKNAEEIALVVSRHAADSLLTVHPDFHLGGYAKTTPRLLQFVAGFARSTGILLDPIYTGKMMLGIYDLIEKGFFNRGESILAIHTGGLTGAAGKQAEFAEILDS